MLVWLWKPFHKCLKGDINVKPVFVNAFITLLILSYLRLLSVSFDLLVYVNVYNSSGTNLGAYLFYDASIKYFGREHLPYAILAILVVFFFIVLPLIFSLLHPLRFLSRCIWKWPHSISALNLSKVIIKMALMVPAIVTGFHRFILLLELHSFWCMV